MLKKFRNIVGWLLGKPLAEDEALILALDAFRDPNAETLPLLQRLIGVLRSHGDSEQALPLLRRLLDRLESDPLLKQAFRQHVVHFVATRRLVTFFTDSGILPGTGFFSEWWRILVSHILPPVPDERQLKDGLHVIYHRSDDWRSMEAIPEDEARRFWQLISPEAELEDKDWRRIQEQMLDGILLLAHRISGMGVEHELMRASPNFDDDRPRFIALSAEALDYVASQRARLDAPEQTADDGSQLLVMIDQCHDTMRGFRKRAAAIGTSLHLSYLLTRAEQSLDRLADLVAILRASQQAEIRDHALPAWGVFTHGAFVAENRRHSLRHYLSQLSRLLAVRVTENAARSGEHYICENRADYTHMWKSADGAGVIIAGMALLKIKAATLHAPLFGEAFLYSMIYGLGFVLIYLLAMTVATKQPAMTAQTLASLLGDLRLNRNADLERLVDVIAAVCRSQLAAIAGNVMVALPVAIAVGFGLGQLSGKAAIEVGKGAHLLADLDILGWALPHAAIAGFYLFLSGLITGYFDNRAAYSEVAARIGRLRWLQRLAGVRRAQGVGQYIQDRLGGIMGNLLFGCMLGSTGIIGILLGLPLDIRHIAFASANLGYALTAFDFSLSLKAVAWAALGVALIGLTNLAVSFTLALRTALGARRIQFEHWGPLLAAIWHRLKLQPRSFVLPPRPVADA